MIRFFIASMILMISLSARAQMVVGNGGGVFESQLVYAWAHLSSYVKPCLNSSACGLTSGQKTIVSEILLEEKSKPLIFVKESERPSIIGKFFETEPVVGAQVYINLDELYLDGEKVLLEKRDFHEAILQMVAVKAFQRGLSLDDSKTLGRKVADLTRTQSAHVGLLQLGFPNLGFSVFSFADSSLVFVSDSNEMYELTGLIAASVPCKVGHLSKTTNLSWSHLSETVGVATAQIFGICDQKRWTADLQITINYYFLDTPFNERKLIFEPQNFKMSIFDFELK